MSGPIVRRYGFPNFDKIFGERPLQHGLEDSGGPEEAAKKPAERETHQEGRRRAEVFKRKK